MSQVLPKASKVAKSYKETPPSESISESPEVMEINSNLRTTFMTYLRIGSLPEDKDEHE
jgi:hypothetical protein